MGESGTSTRLGSVYRIRRCQVLRVFNYIRSSWKILSAQVVGLESGQWRVATLLSVVMREIGKEVKLEIIRTSLVPSYVWLPITKFCGFLACMVRKDELGVGPSLIPRARATIGTGFPCPQGSRIY